MSFEMIVLILHSTLRWIIVLVALIAIVKLALGLSQRRAFDGMSRGLMAGYSGLLDLQMLLGLVLIFMMGLTGTRILHAIILIAAAVAAHLNSRWKTAADATRTRMSLLMVVLSLLLIFFGVAVLGIQRWIPRM